MSSRRIFLFVIIGLALLAAVFSPQLSPVEAQGCSIRADWPVYTVVRGDNLTRIALRYHTTAATLTSANCLANPRVIYAGQQLRVPPGGSNPNPQPGPGMSIPATFQSYERGFMIWRADIGLIWAFADDGRLFAFPSVTYGLLPDNPVRDATPAGRIRPIMGFGRVWGNYVDVRTALGWAVSPEQSFSLVIYPVSARFFVLNRPLVSHRIQVDGSSWAYTDAPVPPMYPPPTSPPPTPNPIPGQIDVWATFQQFENGFMTWHGDSGTIFVYYGLNGGSATAFQSQTYGGLLDNRYGYPPPGRVLPIMGFGKVWGNFTEVRERLGWAVAPERGYMMPVRSQGNGFIFSLPDGQQVSNDYFSAWHFLSGSLPVYPPVAPSPTPQPPVIGDPVQTYAAFQQYEHGFMIWRQDSQAVIAFFDNGTVISYLIDTYRNLPDNPFNGTPPPGQYKPANAFGKVWGNFPLARDLGWGITPEQGYNLVTRTVSNGSGIFMVLPDGRSLFYATSGTWNYSAP